MEVVAIPMKLFCPPPPPPLLVWPSLQQFSQQYTDLETAEPVTICLFSSGIWNWVSNNVLPYVVDWLFVLILGILMAVLSFIIDYIIEKIGEGV